MDEPNVPMDFVEILGTLHSLNVSLRKNITKKRILVIIGIDHEKDRKEEVENVPLPLQVGIKRNIVIEN